jgi:2,3-bisphosphoglycerate-independent phosphoglycerate mutase
MTEKEPIKITLDDLEPEESPTAKPEQGRGKLQEQAEATGRQVAGTARDIAAKVTDKLAAGAADATNRTAEAAREKMGEMLQEQSKAIADAVEQRVREIDWKVEAQKGTEGGLRWLSQRMNELADRMKDQPPGDKETPAEKPPDPKP